MAKPIVLVDDDADLRAILCIELQLQGYHVACFDSAEQALENCGEPPELAIVDYQLPDMDGLTLLKCLRQSYPALPALVISSECGPGLLSDMPPVPATRQLRKPFTATRFINNVRFLLPTTASA